MRSTMHRVLARGVAAAAGLAITATAAAAQVVPVNPFSFGVSAGAAIPTGDAADDFKTGFSVDGIITLRAPALPISLRGEVGYTRFGIKDESDVNFRLLSGVVNAVLTVPAGPTAIVRPYLIGGVGVYSGRASGSEGGVTVSVSTGSKFGLNGGVGLEIPLSGITGFAEVRYTHVFSEDRDSDTGLPYNVNYIPIRFGIRF